MRNAPDEPNEWDQWLQQYPGLYESGVGSFIGGNTNPASYAKGYYDQIPDVMKEYYDPYIEAGRGALGRTQEEYEHLMNDPTQITNRLGANFTDDPGYQFALGQGEQAITNAQAAGGMAGSPQHQQLAAQLAAQMANQYYKDYMDRELGLYGAGLAGMGGINQMGYGASTGLGEDLARALMNQGNLAYTGQQNRNMQGNPVGSMLGGIAGIFGGPLGSALGGYFKKHPLFGSGNNL